MDENISITIRLSKEDDKKLKELINYYNIEFEVDIFNNTTIIKKAINELYKKTIKTLI